MDRSPEVIWALTKKRNNQIVKFQGRHWTTSPYSMSGKWNASEAQRTVGVAGRRDGKNPVFTVSLRTKQKSGIAKRAKDNSQRGNGSSNVDVTRGSARAAKVIDSLAYQNDRDKKLAKRKLAKLSKSLGSTAKGGPLNLAPKTRKSTE
jgi:hypothetical protein